MMESSIALMQMSRTTLAVNELKKKNIPYIVILTDPTTGGVTASWAMLGDILIAEPKATIGFAGRRVIQDTVRETLPEEFQTAEYVKEHGGIDLVIERKYLNSTRTRSAVLWKTPPRPPFPPQRPWVCRHIVLQHPVTLEGSG